MVTILRRINKTFPKAFFHEFGRISIYWNQSNLTYMFTLKILIDQPINVYLGTKTLPNRHRKNIDFFVSNIYKQQEVFLKLFISCIRAMFLWCLLIAAFYRIFKTRVIMNNIIYWVMKYYSKTINTIQRYLASSRWLYYGTAKINEIDHILLFRWFSRTLCSKRSNLHVI